MTSQQIFRRLLAVCALIVIQSSAALAGYKATFTDTGVSVDAGIAGTFVLDYPTLLDSAHKPAGKITEQSHEDAKAVIKYGTGARLNLELLDGGAISFVFTNLPADVQSVRFAARIPFNYSEGGTFQIDDKPAANFPAEKPAGPHLAQANASSLSLHHPQGKVVKFGVPKHSYFDVTDNREWGWKTFAFTCLVPLNRSNSKFQISVTDAGDLQAKGPVEPREPVVDLFGQSTRSDFPAKVHNLDELKADVAAEKAYYDSLNPPAFDAFGGMPGTDAQLGLQKTGFFHVEQKGGKWFLVDPAGNAFYALGVCTYSPGDDYTYTLGRESIYQWLPSADEEEFKTAFRPSTPGVFSYHLANQIRKYGKPFDQEEYAAMMVARLRKWGFNCVGPFGGPRAAFKAANFPYVITLPYGAWPGLPDIPGVGRTWDPFDEKNVSKMQVSFAKALPARADDPLLIGYYLVNEPLYEDVPRVVPRLDGRKFACKAKLVEMLKAKYVTVEAFNTAWNMQAKALDDLIEPGLPVATAAAAADVQEFTNLFFETYYKLVADTFHQHDKNHMLIGNRFQSGTINNENLVRTASKYMDVMSFNYYTYGVDTDFLKRIYKWSGKPLMLTEYFYDSPKESGLPGGGKDVSTQDERGLAYRNYVEQSAATGFVVGATWFTHVDQALTGRWFSKYNGENGNSGLIAVTDRPWKPMLAHAMETNYGIYDLILGNRPAYAWNDPRFTMAVAAKKRMNIPRAIGEVKMDGTAAGFPGTPAEQVSSKRLVEGTDAGGVEAAFKVCWDDHNLYLLANIVDPTPMQNKATGKNLWRGDSLELFIGSQDLDEDGQVLFSDRQLLLGGAVIDGKSQYCFARLADQPECKVVVLPDVNGKGYTVQAAIPFASLGFTPVRNQEIRFDLGINSSSDGSRRMSQLMWNGTGRNSSDRTGWGRAVLGDK